MRPYKLGAEARANLVTICKAGGRPVADLAQLLRANLGNVRSVVARMSCDGDVFTCRVRAEGRATHEVWVFADMAERDAFHAECERRTRQLQKAHQLAYRQRHRELHNERARLARARIAAEKAVVRERELAERLARAQAEKAAADIRRAEREIAKQRERMAREARAAERARSQAEAKKKRERLKAETRAASQMAKASSTARPAPVHIGPALRADGPIIIPEGLVIQRAPTPPDRWAVSNPASVVNSRECRAWAKAVTA